jgi:hypothetical protein
MVEQAIQNGRGKVRVGDAMWQVEGPDTPAGVRVKVVAASPTSARSDGFPRWLQDQSTNKSLILLAGRERKQQNHPM